MAKGRYSRLVHKRTFVHSRAPWRKRPTRHMYEHTTKNACMLACQGPLLKTCTRASCMHLCKAGLQGESGHLTETSVQQKMANGPGMAYGRYSRLAPAVCICAKPGSMAKANTCHPEATDPNRVGTRIELGLLQTKQFQINACLPTSNITLCTSEASWLLAQRCPPNVNLASKCDLDPRDQRGRRCLQMSPHAWRRKIMSRGTERRRLLAPLDFGDGN